MSAIPSSTYLYRLLDRAKNKLVLIQRLIPAVVGGLSLGWPDWEDAIIYQVANSHPLVEAIVTNDGKFVKRAKALKGIKALHPADLLK